MIRHGHSRRDAETPTYQTWLAMKQRCHNPSHQKFLAYGALGVTVCDRWKDSFDAFLEDMGERPDGTTIDRIDSSKGYEPDNCRWATPKQQQRNIKTNLPLTLCGETKLLCEWAEIAGVSSQTIRWRIARGWPDEAVVKTVGNTGNRIVPMKCSTLVAFGEDLPLSEWSKRTGIKANTIRERLRRGYSSEKALSGGLL